MIEGRTATIYGRTDCLADSSQQIQWVTCVEALSQPYFYPQRDNLSYSYTVTNPSGAIIDSGNWTPTWLTAMSSCPSNNSSSNDYTVAYNLTNLTPETPYTFTVSGTTASGSFSGTAVFRTKSAISTIGKTSNFAAISRNLTIGSTGNDVKQLQALLVNEVSYPANLITGYFGTITRNAVKKLQEKYGITPTLGYFGSITRQKLQALYLGH